MEQQDFTQRTKIYYDAEFTGLHRNTTPISIGLMSQSGAYFYAEFNDYDTSQVDDWLQHNIIDNLMYKDEDSYMFIKEFYEGGTGGHPISAGAHRHMNILMKDCTAKIRENLFTWLKFEYEACGSAKLQFYTDCYAYDWVLLMDIICQDGKALNIPSFMDYIPVDLSTAMLIKHVDPDINREEYAGQYICGCLSNEFPFKSLSEHAKHNSLWDVTIAVWCWNKLMNPNRNQRIWDPKAIAKLNDSDTIAQFNVMHFQGEAEHPQ